MQTTTRGGAGRRALGMALDGLLALGAWVVGAALVDWLLGPWSRLGAGVSTAWLVTVVLGYLWVWGTPEVHSVGRWVARG